MPKVHVGMDDSSEQSLLTPGEVARLFRVGTVTVAAWADDGRLRCFRTPGGQRRFRRQDVEAFLCPVDEPEPAA